MTLPPLPPHRKVTVHGRMWTETDMRAYAEQAVAAERARLRGVLTLAESALELGLDALRSEADRYHAEMAGYRPERHQMVEDDFTRAENAWAAVRAVLRELK